MARYGNIFKNCEGTSQPLACATNCKIVIPPKIKAPINNLIGIQEANTTKARAIQPLPAVIPSDQCGVKANGIYAPPIPAHIPPKEVLNHLTNFTE